MHRVTMSELEEKVDFINHRLFADVEGKYYTEDGGFNKDAYVTNESNYKGKFVLSKIHIGYQLEMIANGGGGVKEIGYYRKTAREMYFFLDGFILGIQAETTLELI